MTTVLVSTAGSKFAVGEFLLSIKSTLSPQLELIMRMEHGELVELQVPVCDETRAEVLEEALRLNRGLAVLSLGPLPSPVLRKILSSFIPEHNGLQANTCVSTVKLLNISDHPSGSFCTAELQLRRLAEVANMMKTNSTVEHLEVRNRWLDLNASPYEHCGKSPPVCSSDSPVVTQLQTRLRPGGNLRPFTFYSQEPQHMCSDSAAFVIADNDVEKQQGNEQEVDQKVMKVQCRRYLKPNQVMDVMVTNMERGGNFW